MKFNHVLFLFLIFISAFGFEGSVYARPEYATREKVNCTSCHFTPWGGGPRTQYGKLYGSHSRTVSKLSNQEFVYADLRAVAYYPTQTTESFNGVALMEAAVTGTAPIHQNEDGSEFRGLLTYNIAPLGGAYLREAYLRWQLAPSSSGAVNFLIGRFYTPFGLLTDEHRTYTRIQSQSTINNYSVGGAVSADLPLDLHSDFCVVNDFQTGGAFSTRDLQYGLVLNLRWKPDAIPILLGLSGNYQHTLNQPEPYATSIYTVLSFDRLTYGLLSGSISLERVDAKNWNNSAVNTGGINPSLNQFFIPRTDLSFVRDVRTSVSRGHYLLTKYNLSTMFTLFYKLDALTLDVDVPEDTYFRHGFGVESYLNSNLILNTRYEFAAGMKPSVRTSHVIASEDAFLAMLRLWL